MDLSFIQEMYIPIVLVICLCVGYVCKKWMPTDNKWIPTILLALGAILGCVAQKSITLEAIGMGGFTGLASTGLHQIFTRVIMKQDYSDLEEEEIEEEKEDE